METADNVTRPTPESAAATTAEWLPELATVLTDAVEPARAAIVEFSGADTVGDYLGVGYEDPTSATHRLDRKSTRLNSSHRSLSRMPSSA